MTFAPGAIPSSPEAVGRPCHAKKPHSSAVDLLRIQITSSALPQFIQILRQLKSSEDSLQLAEKSGQPSVP